MRFRNSERVNTQVQTWLSKSGLGGVAGNGVAASGGFQYTIMVGSDLYSVHEFTTSGTLTLLPGYAGIVDVEYLVVAGGGGGGRGQSDAIGGGGGGAGGYRSSVVGELSGENSAAESMINILSSSLSIIIGAGGPSFSDGQNSSLGSITSTGGGGTDVGGARPGGCGGGGPARNTSGDPLRLGASGTINQGFAGGNGGAGTGSRPGGGGGGAGQAGFTAASTSVGGAGGNGIQSSITGTATYRAGGGGGASAGASTTGGAVGGLGGGGRSTIGADLLICTPGERNTGGGGGGRRSSSGTACAGGSGVVIVRYKI